MVACSRKSRDPSYIDIDDEFGPVEIGELSRLTAQGFPDVSFGEGGTIKERDLSVADVVEVSGKLLLYRAVSPWLAERSWAPETIQRLNSTGTIDMTFGMGGAVVPALKPRLSTYRDGKVLAMAETPCAQGTCYVLGRILLGDE